MQNIQNDAIVEESQPTAIVDRLDALIAHLNGASRYIALLTAWVATCGSLFMSEVLLWVPCVLCWYQRILMYPLALLLPVGILRRDRVLHWYVLPLTLTGGAIALYHYLLVKTDLFPPPPCNATIPCTIEYMNLLGFINVPLMALVAFLIISVMVVGSALGEPEAPDELRGRSARLGVPLRALLAVMLIIAAVVIFFVLWGQQIRG